ncbi:MAG TPA: DUF4160 domain-containing protein [Prosthecobacter sp.]|nr:DUF4160 domain-containing protein [Prosthecobacter sp.]
MPEICRFQGIRITMYHNEHGIPHFHARYGGMKAAIALDGTVLAGSLPSNILALIREWTHLRSERTPWPLAPRI